VIEVTAVGVLVPTRASRVLTTGSLLNVSVLTSVMWLAASIEMKLPSTVFLAVRSVAAHATDW